MAGDGDKSNSEPSSSKRPPPSDRKSRWESSAPATATATPANTTKPSKPTDSKSPSTNKPTPKHAPNPNPNPNPSPAQRHDPNPSQQRPPIPPSGPILPFPEPPPPSYGFHLLDRRTIVLADGSARSYFALPQDYRDFPPPPLGQLPLEFGRDRDEYWNSLGLDGPRPGPEGSLKRRFGDGEGVGVDELARKRQQLLQYGNAGTSSPFRREDEFRPSKFLGGFGDDKRQEVDPAVMKTFLNFVKVLNDNAQQRRNYLENGKLGRIQCIACNRSSKDFPDVHSLILHTYNSDNADLRVDHLGLHRALCVLMGWNYLRPPDNSKIYQFLPADEAAANQDDLILWPPVVIIHNTITGKGKDGRMEGLGNKMMDNKIRDLGFSGGKSKSLYSRDGHLGVTLVKFASDQSGLKDAMQLADHFEQGHHGRRDWTRVQSISGGMDDEGNPNLVMMDERTGERRRILYGFLGTASDMDKLDYETRKKVVIESKLEKLKPPK